MDKQIFIIEDEIDETKFTKNLEELLPFFESYKHKIVEFVKNNFTQNIDYFIKKVNNDKKEGRGGHNKIDYLLTEKTFELTKNTYNLKHKYVPNLLNNLDTMMSIESRTVGWVENSYKGVVKTKRQKTIGTYYVDLYFPDYKLIIECDENDHKNRNQKEELERQNYLVSKGYSIIRYDPNDKNFDGSIVMRYIHKYIHNYSKDDDAKLIKVKFV